MNFLSHYYFDRFAIQSEQVLGGLLPDLLKNVDKEYSFQLHKYTDRLKFHPLCDAITDGWNRHVEVDKIFHSSDFFYTHTHSLRKYIEETVVDLPIRASFLAHISLELVLDHLLIQNQILKVERLYEHLEAVDLKILTDYLKVFETVDIERFYRFYNSFVASRYILDYANMNNLPHALFNICKRVWQFDIQPRHIDSLAVKLQEYQQAYLGDYREIYSIIQDKVE